MENNKKMSNLMSVMSFTADKTRELADAGSVLGEPITRDGITVIPVSELSVGFAGGGADAVDVSRRKEQHPAGAGGKINVKPITFLVLDETGAHLLNIKGSGGDVLSQMIAAAKSFLKKDK